MNRLEQKLLKLRSEVEYENALAWALGKVLRKSPTGKIEEKDLQRMVKMAREKNAIRQILGYIMDANEKFQTSFTAYTRTRNKKFLSLAFQYLERKNRYKQTLREIYSKNDKKIKESLRELKGLTNANKKA